MMRIFLTSIFLLLACASAQAQGNSCGQTHTPCWTTGTRPSPAGHGTFGYNTDLSHIEWFNGTSWIAPVIITGPSTVMAIIGDSFAVNAGDSPSVGCTTSCGMQIFGSYFTWSQIYSNYRILRTSVTDNSYVTNCGINGATVAIIYANLSCVLNANPNIVIVEGGSNDASINVSCASVTATNRQIYGALIAAGINVVKISVIPREAPFTYTTAQAQLAQCYNANDKAYAQNVQKGFTFVDLDPTVVDPAAPTTWSIRAGYTQDGIHPSEIGGSAMGLVIANIALSKLAPVNWRAPAFSNGNAYDAANNPGGNLLPNGSMTGSGGTPVVCTGTVANSTSAIAIFAGGATCVGSVTTLADGRGAQVITIGGASTGTLNFVAVIQSPALLSNIQVGDILEFEAWVNIGANTNMAGIEANFSSTENGVSYLTTAANPQVGQSFPTAGWANSQENILITARRRITAVPTVVNALVGIYIKSGNVNPTATVTISNMTLHKVLQ